jgi:hypothetical protein
MAKELLIDTAYVRFSLEESAGGRLRGKGVFARSGVPTANGRIYPESVWRKNLAKLQRDITENKVLMELDHPCLTTEDFKVLTKDGWKQFSDIKIGDEVWSRRDGKAVLSKVDEIINQPYDGAAYRMKGRSIDVEFTPAHKILMTPQNKPRVEEYQQIKDVFGSSYYRRYAIPRTAEWETPNTSQFVIKGVDGCVKKSRKDITQDLVLDAKLFAAFMGIYLSEGNCSADSVDNYDVRINQKNEWTKKIIFDEIISKFPSDFNWREDSKGFVASDARLYLYLKNLGDAYSKFVPQEIKDLDNECLKELVFWFTIGDGRFVGSSAEKNLTEDGRTFKEENWAKIRNGDRVKHTRQDIFSVSEKLVRDLHECIVKIGMCGSFSKIVTTKDYEFAGRMIKAENKVPLYQLHISNSKNIWLDDRFLKIEKTHHKGNIYCLSVTHGNFYMEHNGKSFWTGNSDGKTKLQRVAGKLTSLTINEDGTVFGELEVTEGTPNGDTLKALIDCGCTLGVSSRGYGSVKMNQEGKDVVQDDFVLMTFDVVSDPANATSWPEFSYDGDSKDNKDEVIDAEVEESKKVQNVLTEDPSGAIASIIAEDKPKARVESVIDDEIETEIQSALSDVQHYLPSSDPDKRKKILLALQLVKNLMSENHALTGVAKELGFSLFIERNLSRHPKYKEIIESLGSLKQYNSLDELKGLLQVHIQDAKDYARKQKIEESYNLTKLEADSKIQIEDLQNQLEEKDVQIASQSEELKESKSRLDQMKKEVEVIKGKLTEATARVYLESKIATHPKSFRIRKLWESSKIFDKSHIDFLVESLTDNTESMTESKTYDSVRQSLKRRGFRENIVENSVAGTTLLDAQKTLRAQPKTAETEFFNEDFDRLAGLIKD